MKTLAAVLSTIALISATSALACGRGYSAGPAYAKAHVTKASSKRVAPPSVTPLPPEIQSRDVATSTSAL